jgi:hypothetical protein
MNRTLPSLLCAAGLVLCAGAALAQEHEHGHAEHGSGDYPTEIILRPLELPAGMLEVQANLTASLMDSFNIGSESFGGPFKPTYLGFGASYGVTNQLQVGASSNGFCLTGTGSGLCDHVFDDFAVEAAYGLQHGKEFALSLQAALEFNHLAGTTNAQGNDAPFEMAGGVGIDLRAVSGQFAVRAGPKLVFGLKERGELNKEYLRIPLALQYQVDKHLALEVAGAVDLFLDPSDPFGVTDFIHVPVGAQVVYAIDKHFDVGGAFTFTNLLGKANAGANGFDGRVVSLFAAWRP